VSEHPITIDRCICTGQTFAQLLATGRDRGIDRVEELARCTGAGAGCGLCRPYLRRALRTGEDCFHRVITEVDGEEGIKGLRD
jgi:bacterioferritin-associated ferredoxin